MSERPVVLIAGASRGLGLELVRQFANRGWTVIGTARDVTRAHELIRLQGERPDRIAIKALDLTAPESVMALKAELGGGRLDVLYINAGIMGPTHHDPVRISDSEFEQLMLTNALAPIRLAKALLGNLRDDKSVVVFMTSQLGSVARNESGGYDLYRASKAALNSLTRSFVAKLPSPRPTVLSLHPGWVKTDMGGTEAPLDASTSVAGMVDIVEAARGAGGHRFLDYQGKEIPW
jgi:NAD(P)-dependent dehydrogenase (short-subunit alcohol dehydrogenase family)